MELLLFIDNHNGRFPGDLGELSIDNFDPPQLFVLPQAENRVPTNWQEMSFPHRAKWINRNSAFTYLGGGLVFGRDYSSLTSLPPDKIVIAYQNIQTSTRGIYMLYMDMHVEFDASDLAGQRLSDTNAFLQRINPN